MLNPGCGRSHDRKQVKCLIRDVAVCLRRNENKFLIPRFFPVHMEGGRTFALKKLDLESVPSRFGDCNLRDYNPGLRRELIPAAMPKGIVDDPLFTEENPDPVVGVRHEGVFSRLRKQNHSVYDAGDTAVKAATIEFFSEFEFFIQNKDRFSRKAPTKGWLSLRHLVYMFKVELFKIPDLHPRSN